MMSGQFILTPLFFFCYSFHILNYKTQRTEKKTKQKSIKKYTTSKARPEDQLPIVFCSYITWAVKISILLDDYFFFLNSIFFSRNHSNKNEKKKQSFVYCARGLLITDNRN